MESSGPPKNSGRWREITLDELDALPRGGDRGTVGVNFPPAWQQLLIDAATARNMSLASFVRRAAMAFVVADLGLDWERVMELEPRIRKLGDYTSDPERARGFGYGQWKIVDLEEYTRAGTAESD